MAKFASVGLRSHRLDREPIYVGQPEVALCGTVFIRQETQPTDAPECLDCAVRMVELLRHQADQLIDEANVIAASTWDEA